MQKSDMGEDDWVYRNLDKDLDKAVNEKLEKSGKLRKRGIKKSVNFYQYMAQKFLDGELDDFFDKLD